jgi:hypothetical protein
MKKIALLLLGAVALMGCEKVSYEGNEQTSSNLPETKVFALGQSLNFDATKGYAWPYVSELEGWETARFSIRADRSIPDYTDKSSALYYGRPAGKDGKNRGRVYTAYPYGHYNDRDLDYYKKDKKTGENIGLFRYVYDKKGLKTQLAIAEAPAVEDILDDELTDLTAKKATLEAKGQSTTKVQEQIDDVNYLIGLGHDYLNSHVLWYVVKEVGMRYGWHVNGTIVDYEVGEPDNIPDNVEVDIHQQEHLEWSEIKTSIHVRADVETVEINIPLDFDDIVEQDDFDIRVYKTYTKAYADVDITITHDSKGITIKVSNITAAMIDDLKGKYGDGLTVEVFSYTKSTDVAAVWEKVKKSTVKTGNPCTVVGQITSAYDIDGNGETEEAPLVNNR